MGEKPEVYCCNQHHALFCRGLDNPQIRVASADGLYQKRYVGWLGHSTAVSIPGADVYCVLKTISVLVGQYPTIFSVSNLLVGS